MTRAGERADQHVLEPAGVGEVLEEAALQPGELGDAHGPDEINTLLLDLEVALFWFCELLEPRPFLLRALLISFSWPPRGSIWVAQAFVDQQ